MECVTADGQDLPAAWSDTFDVVISSFALIFFPDVGKGLGEIFRCLAPGGRVAISAWGAPHETPAFRVFPDALAARGVARAAPARIDGSPGGLRALLEAAGFADVAVHGPSARTLRVPSAGAYFDRFALTSPPLQATLAGMGGGERAALRAEVEALATQRGGQPDGSIAIPAMAYFAYGTKPAAAE